MREQQAVEAAPNILDPLQQTVMTLLRDYLNSPSVKRSDVREAMQRLRGPMTRTAVRGLRRAYEQFQQDQDIVKPANIYLVVDASGSMRGERIARAKEALVSFIDDVAGDRDQVALVAFSDDVRELQGLKTLDRVSLKRSISTLNTADGTQLFEAVAFAYDMLQDRGESDRINVIVAMTDGESSGSIAVLESRLREPHFPVLVYTIAYGEEPELDVERIAWISEGQAYPSDPRSIKKLFGLLSAFF